MNRKRVLLAAPNDQQTNLFVDRGFVANGWLVEQFDYRALGQHPSAVLSMNEAFFKTAARKADPFDLVLILKGELIAPGTLIMLRGMGPTIALWNFDPREGLVPWVVERARVVDDFFSIGMGLLPAYWDLGVNAHWLLEGADEQAHAPRRNVASGMFDVGFVGTVWGVPGRREWLARVADAFPHRLHLWGSFPDEVPTSEYHGRSHDLSATIAATSVNLGRDRNPEIERSYGARLFRTLCAGGFLLMNKTLGVDDDFNGCLAVYDSDQDCVDLVRHYLDSPSERRAISERGRERVLERHLFKHRVRELVSICGVD